MLALQIFFALSVVVGHVMVQPPPQPSPPPPSQPPPPGPSQPQGCQLDQACETTYQTEVIGDNPCQAARTFQTCAEAAQSLCSGPIPSHVAAMTSGARAAVVDKCNETSVTLPACAHTCVPYEERATGDWADDKTEAGCQQYELFRTCLQNFNEANCKVKQFLDKAIITYNKRCPRNCTEYYDECSKNLPKLAADETKVQETCLLWSLCKSYDFSKCQQTLSVNYDMKCKNVTLNSLFNDENGTPGITSSLGMVVGMIGVLLLLIK